MEQTNNTYQLNGVELAPLCEEFGSPLYVYDADTIRNQYNRLIKAFHSVPIEIHYACKALTNVNVLQLLRSLGSGLDAVSIQEIHLGLAAGFKPDQILFTPNGVSMQELRDAVKLGVGINIDNISVLEQFGMEFGNTVPICVRVNPHIMAGGNSKISVGHIDSKFGISVYQMPHVMRIIESNNMTVEGVHMHTGSDILDIDVFLRGAEILFDAAKNFTQLKYIDFGSGFKVPYKKDDIETDIDYLAEMLCARFKEFCIETGQDLKMVFEPGKFLVSQAGYFMASVNVIKQTTSTVFAGLNTGLNHLIRPMFYDSYHHITNISNPEGRERLYTVVGYICETDTFGWNRRISEVREDDILCFENAGAYCFSMASNYNSRFRPAEVMLDNGKAYLIRKREDMEDIQRNEVVCGLY